MKAQGWRALALVLVLVLGGCTETTRPDYIAEIVIDPDSLHLAVGGTGEFHATPYGTRADPQPERADQVAWSVGVDGALALDTTGGPSVRVEAVREGTSDVEAELGRGVEAVPVHVQPAGLVGIAIEPSPVVIPRGERVSVRAVLTDATGAELPPSGFRISWTAVDTTVVFVAFGGVETGPGIQPFGRSVGETVLRLVVGDRTTTAPLRVVEPGG